jgi:small subunit ribosomal protein S11
MTDEKQTTEEEIKDEIILDDEEVMPVPEAKTEGEVLEELPEEIKKKLEKQKANRQTMKGKKKKKTTEKRVTSGKAFINSTYNNTIVTLTDTVGNVLSWANAGLAGFKGPKKSTPYAAQIITRIAVEKAKEYGLAEVKVFVKGVGTGRESAVRALNANGLNITYIKDITPLPHNGCRSRKPRRV